MGLQSLQYCAFLVVVAAVYLHLPVRMQPVFLLGASWVFYALAMPAMLPVTIALAVFTYLCGRGLAWRGGAHKTAFLRLGVIGMLGILAFFKYNGLLGGVLHGWRAVAMPLGISFTSFAAIAYLGRCLMNSWSPARFAGELYSTAYTGFYANTIMVAAYWAFAALALALGIWLDHRRNFACKNKPAEVALASAKHRNALYVVLIVFILVGYIMQSGGFNANAFGPYAGF